MKANKNTIRSKLIRRGQIILVFIILIIIASQIVVELLKRTSNELLVEYNEMNAMQEFKLSLYHLQLQANKYSLKENNEDQEFFKILLYQSNEKLKECKTIITDSHNTNILDAFFIKLVRIDKLSNDLFIKKNSSSNRTDKEIVDLINKEIINGLNEIDKIIIETKFETTEYEEHNKTVFYHSTLTILLLGAIIILIIISGGIKFINNLTKPIHDFVSTTKKIIAGDRRIKVNIDSGDEFSILADSFNQMLDTLEETTVSKSYLDNILKNMFDSLIVTDNKLIIRSLNQAAATLLEYPKEWLVGKPINILFAKDENLSEGKELENQELLQAQTLLNNASFLTHSTGKSTPALISCALLKNETSSIEGLIIVGHDLSIRIEIEKKLEKIRKQRQIDINEAQEEERMRIATDLHDGLGQMLTAISYSSQEIQNLDSSLPDQRNFLLEKMQDQINLTIKESKNLAHNLIPIVLKDFGLIVAIKILIERANENYDINFVFNSYDYTERIDVRLEKSLYRICQESLNNIVKHSNAKNANFQIFKQDDLLVLVIDDDGVGFKINTKEEKNKGIGLISMRERVLAFGGDFTLDSQIGNGTEIIIEIPCRKL